MSVAIAAACREGDAPRIVIAFDKKVSTDLWSSETEFKIELLEPSNYYVMFAGNISQARELIGIYGSQLAPRLESIPANDLQEELRGPLWIRKRRMIESIVQRRLGIPYAEFLERRIKLMPV